MTEKQRIININALFCRPGNVVETIVHVRGRSVYKIQKECRLCKKVFNPSREFKWYCEPCTQKYNIKD